MFAKLLGATLTALAVVALAGASVEAQWADPRGGRDQGYRDGRDGRR